MTPDQRAAVEAHERAGDVGAALVLLDAHPLDPAAVAWAGRLRVRATDEVTWARGVEQLEAALEHGVEVVEAYAAALAPRGLAARALPVVRRWAQAHPDDSIGWEALARLTDDADERAEAQLARGQLLLARGAAGPAVEAFTAALEGPRPHEAWRRLGEAWVAQGFLRRALGAFRRAQEVDLRGALTQPLHDAVNALSHVLHHHRRYFLHPYDEAFRHRAGPPVEPVALPELARHARAARAEVRVTAHAALDAIVAMAEARALLPDWSEQSPASELEQHGGEVGRGLAAVWRSAQLELYEELLEREESRFDESFEGQARRAAAERRWPEALEALQHLDAPARTAALRAWTVRLQWLGEAPLPAV